MLSDEIRRLLPLLAKLAGSAAICDNRGTLLHDTCQTEHIVPHEQLEACIQSATSANTPLFLTEDEGVTTAVIRLADNEWLIIDNHLQKTDLRFKEIIIESLPYIAQVAGGDAVLFNRDGIREHAYHPDGSPNPGAIGVINSLCRKAMDEVRPSIGPSAMSAGSTAVRIPLSPQYGVAFNNRLATQRHQRLLADARRYDYARYHMEDIIGESSAITKAKEVARTAARTSSTILISGETGTGKEIFAQAIHNASPRSTHPFIAINCGALPANLVESTLFGYVEGAFSGAKKGGQAGAFEQAHGGTLFLDEISEMQLDVQVKLLRVIQEREVVRVGGALPKTIDVRIIASTNKALADLVKAGQFRSDLYFRLNVLEILIPPLRNRKEDILALTDFFIKRFSNMMGKTINDIAPAAMKALYNYSWPGNVRELANCIEHVFNVMDASVDSLRSDFLPRAILAAYDDKAYHFSFYEDHMRQTEFELVHKALQASNYNKAEAARRLGINRTTFWRILKRHHFHETKG